MSFSRTNAVSAILSSALMALSLTACNSNGADPAAGNLQGTDSVNTPPAPVPTDHIVEDNNTPDAGPQTSATLGEGCESSDPDRVCLALKYVVYSNSSSTPVLSSNETLENLRVMNSLYAKCNVAFQIDEFAVVNPADFGLNYGTSTMGELNTIRGTFENDKTLLIVTTGTWSGSLGAGSANAWAAMPGSGTYGAILEAPVGAYSNIVAHEVGHYLNLDHVSDSSNLLSPMIYDTSTNLTSSQCSTVRSAATYFWKKMLR